MAKKKVKTWKRYIFEDNYVEECKGMSKEEIVELINVNIERINLALSSKASPNKNESDAR